MNSSKTVVKYQRISAVLYREKPKASTLTLVLFNQWRSGAASLFSKNLAELTLDKGVYGQVLFVDRIASGGASDNTLTTKELGRMKRDGDFQFADIYKEAIEHILADEKLPQTYVLGGSSAGAAAALATASSRKNNASAVIIVEPTGLRPHGLSSGRLSTLHAFGRHALAYRHRISRGWWTEMDKEQYFSGDRLKQQIIAYASRKLVPPFQLIVSTDSHAHRQLDRSEIADRLNKPHELIAITGNHDKICQPPSLSLLYSQKGSARN